MLEENKALSRRFIEEYGLLRRAALLMQPLGCTIVT